MLNNSLSLLKHNRKKTLFIKTRQPSITAYEFTKSFDVDNIT